MTLSRLQFGAMVLWLVGTVLWVAALFMPVDRAIVFRAYLFAFLICLGLSLGSLALLMLHHLTGGEWGTRVGPMARAGAATLPLMPLLFIPVCLGLSWLYPWARPGESVHNALVQHREVYLNAGFFLVRAGVYFLIWIGLALLLMRPRPAGLSAAGLILYLFTMTHAGIDWIMSRDTEFYSTAFGFILTVGQTLSALAFGVLLLPMLPPAAANRAPVRRAHGSFVLNDLGNLLMTLVILWAYVSFMQFLVIWMGNSREDNSWYLERGMGGGGDSSPWRAVALLLVLFHFLVPFYVLLFRRAKQNSPALTATAGVLLAAHVLEQYWLVAPSGHESAAIFDPHWVDLAALAGVGGLWCVAFLFLLRRLPAAPEAPVAAVAQGEPSHD